MGPPMPGCFHHLAQSCLGGKREGSGNCLDQSYYLSEPPGQNKVAVRVVVWGEVVIPPPHLAGPYSGEAIGLSLSPATVFQRGASQA